MFPAQASIEGKTSILKQRCRQERMSLNRNTILAVGPAKNVRRKKQKGDVAGEALLGSAKMEGTREKRP